MLFGSKKQEINKNSTEVLEINYLKENRVLQDIIKVSYETNDLITASNKIIQIICKNYSIQYCTLFIYQGEKFKVAGTNVPIEMIDRIENFAELIYKEKCLGNETDAYVLKSEQPMNYDTGWERGIRYMMFSPLCNNGLIGSILIENTSVTLTQDEVEFFELVVENISLVLQNLIYFRQIVDAANKDGLTGIYNRHYMSSHLANAIEEGEKFGRKFSVALFDIDHFKNFNDTYGHLHGDKVLKEVSHYVEKELRANDTIYRYGGEEFVIYFKELGINEAYEYLDRLRMGISQLQIKTDKNEVTQVTVSMGVTEFPTYDHSIQGLIEKADQAMYNSKETGRNRVTKYSDLVGQGTEIVSSVQNQNIAQNFIPQQNVQTYVAPTPQILEQPVQQPVEAQPQVVEQPQPAPQPQVVEQPVEQQPQPMQVPQSVPVAPQVVPQSVPVTPVEQPVMQQPVQPQVQQPAQPAEQPMQQQVPMPGYNGMPTMMPGGMPVMPGMPQIPR
ncbi:MAG: sensor domain-containing diguanylate cyclase [Clostridia bacterium]|nr:sensor domain-containing diguanylate cyclase [Clostridia bacterium]